MKNGKNLEIIETQDIIDIIILIKEEIRKGKENILRKEIEIEIKDGIRIIIERDQEKENMIEKEIEKGKEMKKEKAIEKDFRIIEIEDIMIIDIMKEIIIIIMIGGKILGIIIKITVDKEMIIEMIIEMIGKEMIEKERIDILIIMKNNVNF